MNRALPIYLIVNNTIIFKLQQRKTSCLTIDIYYYIYICNFSEILIYKYLITFIHDFPSFPLLTQRKCLNIRIQRLKNKLKMLVVNYYYLPFVPQKYCTQLNNIFVSSKTTLDKANFYYSKFDLMSKRKSLSFLPHPLAKYCV